MPAVAPFPPAAVRGRRSCRHPSAPATGAEDVDDVLVHEEAVFGKGENPRSGDSENMRRRADAPRRTEEPEEREIPTRSSPQAFRVLVIGEDVGDAATRRRREVVARRGAAADQAGSRRCESPA